jgi:hypothetical protein
MRRSHCRRRRCLPAMTSSSASQRGSLDQHGSSWKVGTPGQILLNKLGSAADPQLRMAA